MFFDEQFLHFFYFILSAATKSIQTDDGNARAEQYDESQYEHEYSTKSTIQRSKFRVYAMNILVKCKFLLLLSLNRSFFISNFRYK